MRQALTGLIIGLAASGCANGQYDAPITLPAPSGVQQQNWISQAVSIAPPRPGLQFTNGARQELAVQRYRTDQVKQPSIVAPSQSVSPTTGAPG